MNDETCKSTRRGWGRQKGHQDKSDSGLDIASSPAAIRSELKKAIEREREKHRRKSEALAVAEAAHDEVVDAMSAILLDEESMDAMVAYGKKRDPKNKKGKMVSEKWKELHESMSPEVKDEVRKIILERIKIQYKKDAKAAENFMKDTLGKLFPDLLPQFFKTRDYNKSKGPEPEPQK